MFRKLAYRTPLAWFQMSREKTRLAVALAGITFADILLFVQLGFRGALYDASVRPHYSLQADLVLINPQFETIFSVKSFSIRRLYQAAGYEGVASISPLYINAGLWRNPINRTDRRILVMGIDPVNSAFGLPEINQHLDELKRLNWVLYDQAGRPEYGAIADLFKEAGFVETEVNTTLVRVTGLFSLGASFAADGNVIASESTFMHIFPNRRPDWVDVGVIRLKPGADIEQVRANLQAGLPSDVSVLTLDGFADREKHYWATTTAIGFIFTLGAAVGFIVGTVIVYQILYSDVSDHLPEYATLKAMGYTERYLISILIQESLILAVLGFIPGLALSFGIYHVAQLSTRLPLIMTVNRAALVLILTITMCVVSGGIAMRKLQTADPADIF